MIKRKGVTKGDIIRAIKNQTDALNNMNNHIMFIDDILSNFITFMKMEKEFEDFLKQRNATDEEE
tara:strand:- start:470 stop:664 length:195 start_codon:yes stop_codon:yes gene_type:complete